MGLLHAMFSCRYGAARIGREVVLVMCLRIAMQLQGPREVGVPIIFSCKEVLCLKICLVPRPLAALAIESLINGCTREGRRAKVPTQGQDSNYWLRCPR